MQEKAVSKRLNYIDALKGFAIVCVVLGHIGNGYMWGENADEAYFFIYNITNAFHMALFMLLSGFVFSRAYCAAPDGTVSFKKVFQQVLNLSIIYILWSLILGFSKLFLGSYVNEPVSLTDIIMIPVKPIQLYWYIFVLIIFYVIFAYIRKIKVNIWLLLAITLILCIASHFIPQHLIFDVKRLLYYSFFFTFGMMLEIQKGRAQSKTVRIFAGISATVLVMLAGTFYFIFWDRDIFLHDRFIVNIVIALGVSIAACFIFDKVSIIGNSRPLGYLGRHSLEIYLIHTFVISAVRALYSRIGVYDTAINLITCLILAVAVPLLISIIFRKIRIYDIFFSPVSLFKKTTKKQG